MTIDQPVMLKLQQQVSIYICVNIGKVYISWALKKLVSHEKSGFCLMLGVLALSTAEKQVLPRQESVKRGALTILR